MEEQETPVTETEVEETQEVQEVAEEATDQHETDEQHEVEETPAEETTEAKTTTPPAPKEEAVEEEFVPKAIERPDTTPPDIRQFVDAEGNLDLMSYQNAQAQWMQRAMDAAINTSREAAQMANRYEKEWSRAEEAYPQLKKDKELKDMVMAIHANSANPGYKYLSPLKAAEKLFGVQQAAKAEGAAGARETRTVQQAAALATPNPPAKTENGANKLNQLKEQMRTGKTARERKEASAAYLDALVKSGRL